MEHLVDNTSLQDGKYRIVRVLGRGGFGVTYLAEYVHLKKRVAIKEFFPKEYCNRKDTGAVSIATDHNRDMIEKLRKRFVKEAQNIAQIDDHPGIVKIIDIFQENGTAYYVMEYIEGMNLLEYVRRNGTFSPEEAVKLIQKIGEALNHVHSRNITHFDIKPSNIMLRKRDGAPIIIDFGLSKKFDSRGGATSSVLQAVSQGYSPLELYSEEGVTSFSPETDVYSLAATLYFLMTGVSPVTASKLLDQGLILPESVPQRYHAVLEKGMEPIRARRFQTVREFCNALKAVDSKTVDQAPAMIQPLPMKKKAKPIESTEPSPMLNTGGDEGSGKSINVILFAAIGGLALIIIVVMAIAFTRSDEKVTTPDVYMESASIESTNPVAQEDPARVSVDQIDNKNNESDTDKAIENQKEKESKSTSSKANPSQTQPKVTPTTDPAAEAAKKAAEKAAQEKADREAKAKEEAAAAKEEAAKKKAAEEAARKQKQEETKKKQLTD